jgi:regulator of replication initiation timing
MARKTILSLELKIAAINEELAVLRDQNSVLRAENQMLRDQVSVRRAGTAFGTALMQQAKKIAKSRGCMTQVRNGRVETYVNGGWIAADLV